MQKQLIQQFRKNEEVARQTNNEHEKKQQQLLKLIAKMEEGIEEQQFEAEKEALIKSYEQKLKKVENELKDYI